MSKLPAILAGILAVSGMAVGQIDPPRSGLLGHWKLDDEKSSSTAADSSGHGLTGKLVRNPLWTEGKVGGALTFDGKDGHVELPRSKEMDALQAGSYTISAHGPSRFHLHFGKRFPIPGLVSVGGLLSEDIG
jgi:hypothetical protein